jgi:predicted DNA binding CopG/RHH family protein
MQFKAGKTPSVNSRIGERFLAAVKNRLSWAGSLQRYADETRLQVDLTARVLASSHFDLAQ